MARVTMFVSDGGSDANNGSTWALRKATLSSAITAAGSNIIDFVVGQLNLAGAVDKGQKLVGVGGGGSLQDGWTMRAATAAEMGLGSDVYWNFTDMVVKNTTGDFAKVFRVQGSVTASQSGTTVTITATGSGTVLVGQALAGTGYPAGTYVTAIGTYNGVSGTVTVNTSATAASTTVTADGYFANYTGTAYPSLTASATVSAATAGTTDTGCWVTVAEVQSFAYDSTFRVPRVWVGGTSIATGQTAEPSCWSPYNEIFESKTFGTLGQDDSSSQTTLGPNETWLDNASAITTRTTQACSFTGSITTTTLTVTAWASGPPLAVGQAVNGTGVTTGTTISGITSAWDGTSGTYTVSTSQSASSTAMTGNARQTRLFVYQPAGNPATIWGGISFNYRRALFSGYQVALLSVQDSNGWTIDSSVKVMGGSLGTIIVYGNCDSWVFEPEVNCFSQFMPVIYFGTSNAGANKAISNAAIAPAYDQRLRGRPYYEIDKGHDTGASDLIQFTISVNFSNVTIKGKAQAGANAGRASYFSEPGHACIARPAGGAGTITNLVVEPHVECRAGGGQYQRYIVLNTGANIISATIGGRVFGQLAPSQLEGNFKTVGLEYHSGGQLIPASPEGVTPYASRFVNGGTGRAYANNHPNGKNRDCVFLSVIVNGKQEVVDCVFDGPQGSGLYVQCASPPDGVSQLCIISRNVFIKKGHRNTIPCAITLDGRNSLGAGVMLINNTVVGYPANLEVEHIEMDGFYRFAGPPESLTAAFGTSGTASVKFGDGIGALASSGWTRYASQKEYLAVQRRLIPA
jgi:hypothetical protein